MFFSLAGETFFASYGLLMGEQAAVDSLLYLLASMIFIFSILLQPETGFSIPKDSKKEFFLKLILVVVMTGIAWISSRFWFSEIPIDPDYADMLPVIKVMNERFLSGHWRSVYDRIPEIWNGVLPIYLPAMWLPYSGAVFLQMDMRWVTAGAVLLSFFGFLRIVRIKQNGYFGIGLLSIAALLFWWIFARNDIHNLISMSEEGVVILYFVLLTIAILSGNIYFISITASLCMLSRYSMIGWLIPFMFYLFIRKEFRKLFIFLLTGFIFFLFLLLIPFGFKMLERMIALPGNYIVFAKRIWEHNPEVYWLNPGLAKFYGPSRIAALHKTLLVMSFLAPFLFLSICQFQKRWKLENINLACFKLSIVIFYQFIDVPYGYLFYTSSFVSLIIASVCLKPKRVEGGFKP